MRIQRQQHGLLSLEPSNLMEEIKQVHVSRFENSMFVCVQEGILQTPLYVSNVCRKQELSNTFFFLVFLHLLLIPKFIPIWILLLPLSKTKCPPCLLLNSLDTFQFLLTCESFVTVDCYLFLEILSSLGLKNSIIWVSLLHFLWCFLFSHSRWFFLLSQSLNVEVPLGSVLHFFLILFSVFHTLRMVHAFIPKAEDPFYMLTTSFLRFRSYSKLSISSWLYHRNPKLNQLFSYKHAPPTRFSCSV